MWAAAEELESKISLDVGFAAKRSQFSGESSTPKIVGIHSKNAKELLGVDLYNQTKLSGLDFDKEQDDLDNLPF